MNTVGDQRATGWRQALPTAGRIVDGLAAARRFLRRRPRWLLAIASIAFACGALWWNDHRSAENQAIRRVESLGGRVGQNRAGLPALRALRGTVLELLLRMFTAKGSVVGLVIEGKQVSDSDIAEFVAAFPRLGHIDVSSTPVTDESLEQIGSLPLLYDLKARHTQITDAGVGRLAGLRHLQFVELDGTRITDAGLAELAKLPNLWTLSLSRTQITDRGLAQLQGLNLNQLMIRDTRITDAGVAAFQAANPKCVIIR